MARSPAGINLSSICQNEPGFSPTTAVKRLSCRKAVGSRKGKTKCLCTVRGTGSFGAGNAGGVGERVVARVSRRPGEPQRRRDPLAPPAADHRGERSVQMTVRFMLDTDIVSYALRGQGRVAESVARHPSSEICISAITMAQLCYGVTGGVRAKCESRSTNSSARSRSCRLTGVAQDITAQ